MQGYPQAASGQVIGLLGGSFDPAHDGHVFLTLEAIKRFGLDRVWWVVSPGNPLKQRGPAPLADRMAHARSIMDHPKVVITDIEARLGTSYTAETLAALQARYRDVTFVWLMGADNLAQLDQWQDWHQIMARVPLGVVARPGDTISGRMSKAARIYRNARLAGSDAVLLGRVAPPVWSFVNMPLQDISSTRLRADGDWPSGS